EVAPTETGTTIDVALQPVGVAAVLLNVTVLAPWLAPKFVPVIVTGAPAAAEGGDRLTMLDVSSTVNAVPALATPLTVTTTLPEVAPTGTGTTIDVARQPVGVAAVPLNVTVLAPWLAPKFVPVMVTSVPTVLDAGDRLVMLGVSSTVNAAPALATPFTVTTTFPEVAPTGTGTTIDVALQLVGVAAVPLNVTVLAPWLAPKFVPVMVTGAPTAAEGGDRLTMLGVSSTVNAAPALATPLTVTTTLPEVAPTGTGTTIDPALQLVGVAAVPLNVTVLVPWLAPKFVPVIVTSVPTVLDAGDRLVMLGVSSTVNAAPALATPFTVTTTFPEVAPTGTGTTIDVALQLVGVAAVPLNVTVLAPWLAPKFVPVMVTGAPTAAEGGDRLTMLGVSSTVNAAPALATPLTVTTTLPEVAPTGTGTTIDVALQLVGAAAVPLNDTVLALWLAPKFVPVMVTSVPTVLDAGDRLVMLGVS